MQHASERDKKTKTNIKLHSKNLKGRGNLRNVGVFIQKQVQNTNISHNGSTVCNKINCVNRVGSHSGEH